MKINNNFICIKDNKLTRQRGVETSFCVRDIGFEYHFTSVEIILGSNDTRICKKCLRRIKRLIKRTGKS